MKDLEFLVMVDMEDEGITNDEVKDDSFYRTS